MQENEPICSRHSEIIIGIDQYDQRICQTCLFYMKDQSGIKLAPIVAREIQTQLDEVAESKWKNFENLKEMNHEKVYKKIIGEVDDFFNIQFLAVEQCEEDAIKRLRESSNLK